ncbi:MAG: hypothetical protein WDZ31_11300 [Phycisphaeraceae bacterium]
MNDARFNQSPGRTLASLRLLWAMLLLGQVAFGVIVLGLLVSESVAIGAEQLYGPLTLVAAAMLAVLTPAGYFIRNQCYKARWEGHAVAPAGYFKGNVILFALLESVAMMALVTMLVTGRLPVPGLIALVAMMVQAVNFPTGAPMQPHAPDFASESRPD